MWASFETEKGVKLVLNDDDCLRLSRYAPDGRPCMVWMNFDAQTKEKFPTVYVVKESDEAYNKRFVKED